MEFQLERYSELECIIKTARGYFPNIHDIISSYDQKLEIHVSSSEIESGEDLHRRQVPAEQLRSQNENLCGNWCNNSPASLQTSPNLYFRSRSCYNELRRSITFWGSQNGGSVYHFLSSVIILIDNSITVL